MAYTIFRIPIGYRLYDREKNKVVPLHEEEYQALERIRRGEGTADDQAVLRRMQEKGFCCESTLEEIEHPATHTVQASLESKIQQMVLQVTQNCNLRCSYCAYSGKYYNRQHNNKRMSLDTALRAVDFLMEHSSGVDEVVLGFYGGEPVLEFDLIKKVVEYVESQYAGRKVRFNFTTNLTLFTDEIIDYILEKKIDIMISLDGPKKVQDKYRIFADGRGSYETVTANARRLRDKDPERFQRFSTNTVASPGEDYEGIRDFLDHDELFGPLHSMFTQVNESGLKEEVVYSDDYYRMVRREKFKVMLYMAGEISGDKVSRVFANEKSSILLTYRELTNGGTAGSRKGHPGGPCVPGLKRLFVDVDGNFYPCERIAEFERFQVGNLQTGFDLERVRDTINVGRYTKEECLRCWAFLFCGTCIASMADGAEPSRKKRLSRCPGIKADLKSRLSDLEVVKHYGYDFSEEGSEEER